MNACPYFTKKPTQNQFIFLTSPSFFNIIGALPQKTVIGFRRPFVTKRTSADVLALFLCLKFINFLWQCEWESRKVRRFLVSGTANPVRAVALSFRSDGVSPLNLTKETDHV